MRLLRRMQESAGLAIALPVALVCVLLGCLLSFHFGGWVFFLAFTGLAVFMVVWALVVTTILDRYPKPRAAWECPHCRYDRRGLAAGARCPECGRRAR